jgi:hypothetical protein
MRTVNSDERSKIDPISSPALNKFYSAVNHMEVPIIVDYDEIEGLQSAIAMRKAGTPFVVQVSNHVTTIRNLFVLLK